ncbi:mucin-2-like isoform X2 [Macrobrachium nipponense]|uniref:mucin-2-like isoform X2 n=1 Tax=Macrobrachium nipponense TaxID=159736 RepID=UPI0030C82D86
MLQCRKEFLVVILASTLTVAPKSALGSVFGTLQRLREVDDALIHAEKSLDDLYNLIETVIGTTTSETTSTSLEPTESSRETSSSLLTSTATPSSFSTSGTSTKGPTTHLSETTSTSSEPTESSQETISSSLTVTDTPSFSTIEPSTNRPSALPPTILPTSNSSTSPHSVSIKRTSAGVSSSTPAQNTLLNELPIDTNSLLPMASFIREILRTKKYARNEALVSISSLYRLSPGSFLKTTLRNLVHPLLVGSENSASGFSISGNEKSFQRMKELLHDKTIKVSGQEGLSPALTNLDMATAGNLSDSTFGELLSSVKNSLITGLNNQFQSSPKDQFVINLKWLLSTWKVMEKEEKTNNSEETTKINTSDKKATKSVSDKTTTKSISEKTTTVTTSADTTKITTPGKTTKVTTSAKSTIITTPGKTTKVITSADTTKITTPGKTTKVTTSAKSTKITTPGKTTAATTSAGTTQTTTSERTTRLSTPSPTVMTTSTTQATVSTTPKTPASWRNETTAVVQAMQQIMLQIDDGNADHTHAFELEQSASLLDGLVLEGKEFEEVGQLNVSSGDLAQVASVKKVAQTSEETIKEKIDEAEVKTLCQPYG